MTPPLRVCVAVAVVAVVIVLGLLQSTKAFSSNPYNIEEHIPTHNNSYVCVVVSNSYGVAVDCFPRK